MRKLALLVGLFTVLGGGVASAASDFVIPGNQISYVYPLDFGPAGPGEGDSAQPRTDLGSPNGDSGGELTNGVYGGTYDTPGTDSVAFNENSWPYAPATDTGDPQPRIDFNLGGSFELESVRIDYWTGGRGALIGPELL